MKNLIIGFLPALFGYMLQAQSITPEGFRYTNTASSTTITGYEGSASHITLPISILGVPVIEVGKEAFYGATSIISVTIPTGIRTLGQGCFMNCTSLQTVTIPSTVSMIQMCAFSNCSSLYQIRVEDNNPTYSSIDGVLFNRTKSTLISFPGGISGRYTIPSTVTEILGNAFYGCRRIEEITIPGNILTIGAFAFAYCESLRAVYFQGDAPRLTAQGQFDLAPRVTIYFPEAASGWSATYGTRPTQSYIFIQSPTIASPPMPVQVVEGEMARLAARAIGVPTVRYQWYRNGSAIPSATLSELVIPAVSRSNAGRYSVSAVNLAGSAISSEVTLDVYPSNRLSNISVRTSMAEGQTLIVGAVVGGQPKNIVIRAAGPALNQFGVTGMQDPRLELFTGGSALLAANENWPIFLETIFRTVGAFPFTVGSKDAALTQLLSGAFTAQIRGTGAGIVLAEAYDVGDGTSSRILNVSARNRVGTASEILIAGFSIAGRGSKRVLVRAVGPTLGTFGVTGALSDPRLVVLDSGGKVLAENDNWESALSATFIQVGAFSLSADSKDAALVIVLNAGASYTVQVSGVGDTVGESLVEVYEIL